MSAGKQLAAVGLGGEFGACPSPACLAYHNASATRGRMQVLAVQAFLVYAKPASKKLLSGCCCC